MKEQIIMDLEDAGFKAGKEFCQKKVSELLDEVEQAYVDTKPENSDETCSNYQQWLAQVNAIRFAKSWIASGGHKDFDGNRVCLVW